MSFATREARANAAVFKHLANARATLTPAGGSPGSEVPVILDPARGVVDADGAITYQPVLDVQASHWPAVSDGDGVAVVGGASYRVRSVLAEGDSAIVTVTLARL